VPSLAVFLVSVEIAGVFLVANLVFTVITRRLGPRATTRLPARRAARGVGLVIEPTAPA
jgi:hypothetical protein